jgi:RNA polymerase sigma-70 factor (ECF subfamily)
MIEAEPSPVHALPSGLCEDTTGEAAALIERMGKGDGTALAELHGMWSPVLLGISCRMLGDRREAEQVVQDTFVRMWRGSAEYDPHQSPPFVWAFVTMRALVMERLRMRRRNRLESPPDPAIQPSERRDAQKVISSADCRRLWAAMDQLDLKERACLELAAFLGFARTGIPATAGASPGTVKNHLRRALETVRNHLSRHEL